MDQEEECSWDGENRNVFPVSSEDGGILLNLGTEGGGRDSASSQFESCYVDSALPSDSDHAYDHHSSEEELEVINNSYQDVDDLNADSILGEDEVRGPGCENKRKWSQVAANRLSVESTSSSDDEVQGLLRPLSTPVEFCTSPPVDVHKPSRSQSPPPKLFLFSGASAPEVTASPVIATAAAAVSSSVSSTTTNRASPADSSVIFSPSILGGALLSSGVFRGIHPYSSGNNSAALEHLAPAERLDRSHFLSSGTSPSSFVRSSPRSARESSSRKRHRHHNPRHIQRPWLDFEKMQQVQYYYEDCGSVAGSIRVLMKVRLEVHLERREREFDMTTAGAQEMVGIEKVYGRSSREDTFPSISDGGEEYVVRGGGGGKVFRS
ncbi:unnamed protein product [Allacma fusca]|uniref:Uncharacterized protein n=1 Tax=Allacma fusca TaxID=39272 RepID=A0A8J2KAJ4_9HEXA|nr:unnamed protein product [Allacma fusca]